MHHDKLSAYLVTACAELSVLLFLFCIFFVGDNIFLPQAPTRISDPDPHFWRPWIRIHSPIIQLKIQKLRYNIKLFLLF